MATPTPTAVTEVIYDADQLATLAHPVVQALVDPQALLVAQQQVAATKEHTTHLVQDPQALAAQAATTQALVDAQASMEQAEKQPYRDHHVWLQFALALCHKKESYEAVAISTAADNLLKQFKQRFPRTAP